MVPKRTEDGQTLCIQSKTVQSKNLPKTGNSINMYLSERDCVITYIKRI